MMLLLYKKNFKILKITMLVMAAAGTVSTQYITIWNYNSKINRLQTAGQADAQHTANRRVCG